MARRTRITNTESSNEDSSALPGPARLTKSKKENELALSGNKNALAATSVELVSNEQRQILERLDKLEASFGDLRARHDSFERDYYKQKYLELQQRYKEKCNEIEAQKSSHSKITSNNALGSVPDGSVPRPQGTAGTHYSIQVAMGLAGSEEMNVVYQGILRDVKDLARANLDWELPWKDIETEKKLNVFRMAREKQPFLNRFKNDWATEDIIKQYFKNRRSHSYRTGFIKVPEQYAYLKENAQKRSTGGSRVKKANAVLAERKEGKEESGIASKKRSRSD